MSLVNRSFATNLQAAKPRMLLVLF